MKHETFTLRQLKSNEITSVFSNSYINLLLNRREQLTNEDLGYLLKSGIVMLNYGDDNLQRLGYRIILRYSILTSDYKPLYDVALNKGFIPVSKQVEDKHLSKEMIENSFFRSYFSAYQDNFKDNGIYLSYGQKKLISLTNTARNNVVVVAPTSYGKSEIIIQKIAQNLISKICVIVPSKALLAQTKRRILNSAIADTVGRIITHSEMYRGDEKSFVAVLTQERLLRLLQRNPKLTFDFIFVDEAHNIFKKDNRATLLTQVIMILKKRNSAVIFNFFSPFISDPKKLRIPYADYTLESVSTEESIKVEKYFYCDLRKNGHLYLYDQFLNESRMYDDSVWGNELELINKYKAEKNIIYLNRPKDIQAFALLMTTNLRATSIRVVDEVIATIADFLHPEYHLLKCLRAGIVYHHGGMPEIIRLYVEETFSKNPHLQFIVTNSTLLEGVNIPAEKIFLLTYKIGRSNFSKSEFKNLIGRICRFSEVFDRATGRIEMLEPEVYLIGSRYLNPKSNLEGFYQKTAKIDIKVDDNVENVLLKNRKDLTQSQKNDLKSKLQYVENIEPNTVNQPNLVYAKSEIGRLCFKNNVYDFDIMGNEDQLVRNLKRLSFDVEIDNVDDLMDAINDIFFRKIDINNDNIKRLTKESARKFYTMVLDWRTSGTSYKEMIANFMGYWRSVKDKVVYFGKAWGEITRDEEAFVPTYIDLATKSNSDRINLAIIKIKEEQDFVEYNLLKYIDILNDLELLDSVFYDKIKYGSADSEVITLLKNGFSIELAKILVQEYRSYIQIDLRTDIVSVNPSIVDKMIENEENKILIFEINYHIRTSKN